MDSARWQLPEDISVDFQIAGPGSRFLAFLLDQLIIGSVLLILYVAAFAAIALTKSHITANIGMIIIISAGAINILYFAVFEAIFQGSTLGKKVCGLRVVMANGSAVTPIAAILRNLMRIIDALPSFYLIGFIFLVFTKDNQRLGDIVAGTLVVRLPSSQITRSLFQGETYRDLSPKTFNFTKTDLLKFGTHELDLLRRYFWRTTNLGPRAKMRITAKLTVSLSRKLGIPAREPLTRPDIFLKELFLALRDEYQTRI